MKRVLLSTALALAASFAAPQEEIHYFAEMPAAVNLLRDAVLTLKGAYIMLPPKAVLRDVDRFEWNSSGTRILAVTYSQKEEVDAALENLLYPPPVTKVGFLAVVDPKTMKTRWVSGIDRPLDPDISISFPEKGDFCLVGAKVAGSNEVGPPLLVNYIIDLGSASARLIPTQSPHDEVMITPFEKGRSLLIIFPPDAESSPPGAAPPPTIIHILDERGQISPPPPGLERAMGEGWSLSHWSAQLGVVLRKYGGDYGVLLPSGTVQAVSRQTVIDGFKLDRDRAPAAPPHLLLTEKSARQGREAWLMAQPDAGLQPAALVCALTEHAGLSPRLDAVAYTSQRMLWIRSMVYMDGELAVLLREKLYREALMMKAKQIGTSLMIYATDYDDCFPTGDPVTSLMPYAKDEELFKGFIFNFKPGQNAVDIDNPAESEIGYFRIPGGRIVTYADSHVKWVPDK